MGLGFVTFGWQAVGFRGLNLFVSSLMICFTFGLWFWDFW